MGDETRRSDVPVEREEGGLHDQPSRWEWVTATVSALLVLSSVGYVAYQALTEPGTPPEIAFEVVRVVDQGDRFVVEVWVINNGGTTAHELDFQGVLLDANGTVVETAATSVSFLPSDSRRMGGLYFDRDPREHELVLRPIGYELP